MQFITNGPDIPEALLQAHEEGRVVFFCGAGISYPAGLPGFEGLVKDIYKINGTSLKEIEQGAFNRGQFDAALDLLERRLPGQRLDVRRALAKALKPKLRRKGATDTQAALLRLARTRQGALRLVTTNFDRVFHSAARRTGQSFQSYIAPMLPIPKSSRWDGLVYLHGLLPEKEDDTALNRLVVTSGDFGLAYLTERWAARFVSELFRNYVVCFVGYSINDPVLRYMMDALAADRMLGESTPQAWALGDCEPGQQHQKTIEWASKGVAPILYEVLPGSNDHSKLHRTLQSWAETYRDGVLGKERIVITHALAQPTASTQQDDFVGRMLWALSDKSGLPAKCFAEFNPAPALDWLLEAFFDNRFGHHDLARFNVPPHKEVNLTTRFSLIHRPAAYDYSPPMLLVGSRGVCSNWDEIMSQLARWLTRHLNDPRLVVWAAGRGDLLHDQWQWLIDRQLDRLDSLEREGRAAELDEVRLHSPNAIPNPQMRILWRLFLSGAVRSPWNNLNFYSWKSRVDRDGLTPTLRMELRQLLTPKISLKSPLRWNDKRASPTEVTRIDQLVDWELRLAADHIDPALRDMVADDRWSSMLPKLLEDFQQLLCDALDLLSELGVADEHRDQSHWHLPSITSHWQNRGFHEWVTLIELLRDTWLAVRTIDSSRATRTAQDWFERPYPTFKRLALFAASQDNCIHPEQWVSWLLSDGAWWLWSTDTGREVFRLLVLQGQHLAAIDQQKLETAILAGPPREMFLSDLEEDSWRELVDHLIWLHLAKLGTSGLSLGVVATERLNELSAAYPRWRLALNESDEFSHWMSGTGDPDYEDKREVDIAPTTPQELVEWLRLPARGLRPGYEDTWRDVCRTHFFESLNALDDLSKENVWPVTRWRDALHTWSEDDLIIQSWENAAPLVHTMPTDILQDIIHGLTRWMEAATKSSNAHSALMLDLFRRVLEIPLEADFGPRTIRNGVEIYDSVTSAINHPIGVIAQALINLWISRNPNDGEHLPDDLSPYFTQLCDVTVVRYRHGRVLLASRLITFFRVDQAWTQQRLLPLFGWHNSAEAKAVWEGFLWSPRLYQPLLAAFKLQFLDTAHHYDELGDHRQQFATFLTFAALASPEGFTIEEFRTAVEVLPQEGLERCAQALSQAIGSAADQREEYWRNRIQPFWQNIWPKSRELATPQISESLARLVVAAGTEFPAALAAVENWLQPIQHPNHIVQLLNTSGFCSQFPLDALRFLTKVIANPHWVVEELETCLNQIETTVPHINQDIQHRRLRDLFRTRRG